MGASCLVRLQQVLATALPESIYLLRDYQDHVTDSLPILSAPLSGSPRLGRWSKKAEEGEGGRERSETDTGKLTTIGDSELWTTVSMRVGGFHQQNITVVCLMAVREQWEKLDKLLSISSGGGKRRNLENRLEK